MTLVLEQGEWKVQWEEGLILPELTGGNRLALYIEQPARGDINDKNGNTLATQTEAVALGVWPGQIFSGQEGFAADHALRDDQQTQECHQGYVP